jgi:hypothetical protein
MFATIQASTCLAVYQIFEGFQRDTGGSISCCCYAHLAPRSLILDNSHSLALQRTCRQQHNTAAAAAAAINVSFHSGGTTTTTTTDM